MAVCHNHGQQWRALVTVTVITIILSPMLVLLFFLMVRHVIADYSRRAPGAGRAGGRDVLGDHPWTT